MIRSHIFNGATRESGFRGQPHCFGYCPCIITKAVFKIGAYRQIGGWNNLSRMLQHFVAADRVVTLTHRKCISCARCREGFKSQKRQQPRGADVPWIWNDECFSTFMQRAKCFRLFWLTSHKTSVCYDTTSWSDRIRPFDCNSQSIRDAQRRSNSFIFGMRIAPIFRLWGRMLCHYNLQGECSATTGSRSSARIVAGAVFQFDARPHWRDFDFAPSVVSAGVCRMVSDRVSARNKKFQIVHYAIEVLQIGREKRITAGIVCQRL